MSKIFTRHVIFSEPATGKGKYKNIYRNIFFQLQIYLQDASSSVSLQHKFEKKNSITEPATESTKNKLQMFLQELAVDVGAISTEISKQFQLQMFLQELAVDVGAIS